MASESSRVQVSVPVAKEQSHPVPVALTYVKPAGRVSVTVTVPWLLASPTLDTSSSNVA